jgi:hypothetical protein
VLFDNVLGEVFRLVGGKGHLEHFGLVGRMSLSDEGEMSWLFLIALSVKGALSLLADGV